MKQIDITTIEKQHTYPIYIGTTLVEKITTLCGLEQYSQILIVTDTQVHTKIVQDVLTFFPKKSAVVILPSGEKAKELHHVESIWKELVTMKADRKSLIINIGGGVIGDIGGFAASTYMRGIAYINIPTTLLSQVDASVGGKNAINLLEIKNLIGTFTQPAAVMIDISLLQTLPDREFLSGFAEIIKHGLIYDKEYFAKVTSKNPREFSVNELIDIIEQSLMIKSTIVQQDPTEKGIRKLLNVGHTIGHALESESQQRSHPLLHGEAVALGIVAESYISLALNLLSQQEVDRISSALTHAGLPIKIAHISIPHILKKIALDKKNEHQRIRFSLLTGIGKANIDCEIDEKIILDALQKIRI